jgi:predicted P-loop ATPase
MSWGASPSVWRHFSKTLGLTSELLPCVLNQGATISPDSKMKRIGKTPSWYNRRGHATGIQAWPERQTTEREVEAWSKVADYGVCIQTRRVRAMDIDVPDLAKAEAIAACIESIAGVGALRYRPDSGKRLIPFVTPGNYSKTVLQVDGGMIEFLAGGRQFVAAGRHEHGAMYAWRGGLPTEFPVWSDQTLAEVLATLDMVFGIEERGWTTGGTGRARRDGGGAESEEDLGTDEVADWLEQNWPNFGRQKDMLLVECPWKAEHSMDSGDTESAWLIRGTRGYEQGHYRCFHGHCNDRGREAFLTAVGWTASGFDVIEAPKGLNGHQVLARPAYRTRDKGAVSTPIAIVSNLILACERPDQCGRQLAYDTFRDETMVALEGADKWETFRDFDAIDIRNRLERLGFDGIGRETMRDAIQHVAERNSFDSAVRWLEGLAPWDGVERVGRFLSDYMGAPDTPYTRAVARYAWTAHVGRVLEPGCKVDMIIVLVGPQGQQKSTAIATIAPDPESFEENISLDKIDQDDTARKMRGVMVAELAELRGLNSKDSESIRAWITRRFESWRPVFREKKIIFKRRLVFWATANEDEILADPAGERRWLPVHVIGQADPVGVALNRDQLWAEALFLWRAGGILWEVAERLAKDEHAQFKVTDPWDDRLTTWLDETDLAGQSARGGKEFTLESVATGAFGLDMAHFGKREEMRISKMLRAQGFDRSVRWADGRPKRFWIARS